MKVTSIFLSVNGECCEDGQGSWTTFVRFSGCSAKCLYCDTQYSFFNDKEMSPVQIVKEIEKVSNVSKRVTITGGEPLEQDFVDLYVLIEDLVLRGYKVSVETNGCHSDLILKLVKDFPEVSFVVDYKLPSAGLQVSSKMRFKTFLNLPANCFIKFVIQDEQDFYIALQRAQQFKNSTKAQIYFSPCGVENASWLFQLMKNSDICVRYDFKYNLQIHKIIFPKDWREEEQ